MITLNTIYNKPCNDTLDRMDDGTLDCGITSPPYWQKRDYKWSGQWGLEPTPEQYLENLWSMADRMYRKLKPTGTFWVNLGDTYGSFRGKSGVGPDSLDRTSDKHPIDKPSFMRKHFDKCLLLLPHRFAIGCMERGWKIRNDIIWAKRNGMPESVTDRFSSKHEYIFLMVKSDKYYFNLDSIRDPIKNITIERYARGNSDKNKYGNGDDAIIGGAHNLSKARPNRNHKFGGKKLDGWDKDTTYSGKDWIPNLGGKNPGDVADFWDITTKSNKTSHYASYNDNLLLKPILAGCPEGGIIYDPFCGSGTTLECAVRSGRNYIGSEGSAEYCEIARKRLEKYVLQTSLLD